MLSQEQLVKLRSMLEDVHSSESGGRIVADILGRIQDTPDASGSEAAKWKEYSAWRDGWKNHAVWPRQTKGS